MSAAEGRLDIAAAEALERKYDNALDLRHTGPRIRRLLYWFTIAFALYHYLTAGLGLPVDYWHMGLHLAGLFVLIFTGFPLVRRTAAPRLEPDTWWRYGNVPLYDWILIVLGIAGALHLGASWRGWDFEIFGIAAQLKEQALRQGNPADIDIVFGTIIVVLALEIARRSLGFVLPCTILVFVGYALLGPSIPVRILRHPGVDWRQFVNNFLRPMGPFARLLALLCGLLPVAPGTESDIVGAVLWLSFAAAQLLTARRGSAP